VTKFAAYVARILCESCKFGEKIFYSNRDNEFFLRDCFLLAHPVYRPIVSSESHLYRQGIERLGLNLLERSTVDR